MQSEAYMQQYVIAMLKEQLPDYYHYHNYEHTLYVMDKVTEIGQREQCSKEEITLLRVAALWHDTGYTKSYANHEAAGCVMARQELPRFGYTATEIEAVCSMIMATKIPQTPTNKLEEIIADADLEYLGTNEAAEKANGLFLELSALIPSITKTAWDNMQISFLQSHHFFTPWCQQEKEPLKQTYLKQLMENSGSNLH